MSIRRMPAKQGRKSSPYRRWFILAGAIFPEEHTLAGRVPFEERRGPPGRTGGCIRSQLGSAASTALTKPGLPAPIGLTVREREVLRLIAEGLTNVQIARQLVISVHTVNAHVRSIFNKLDVPSRIAATRFALEQKLV